MFGLFFRPKPPRISANPPVNGDIAGPLAGWKLRAAARIKASAESCHLPAAGPRIDRFHMHSALRTQHFGFGSCPVWA